MSETNKVKIKIISDYAPFVENDILIAKRMCGKAHGKLFYKTTNNNNKELNGYWIPNECTIEVEELEETDTKETLIDEIRRNATSLTPAEKDFLYSEGLRAKKEWDEYMLKNNADKTPEVALKFDSNKPDLTDIPLDAMFEMGKAFSYGQQKYNKNNFRNGHKVSRCLAAALRHIYQHLDGQTFDTESKVTHLGHAMASLAMAIYSFKQYPENDDRFAADIKRNEGARND